MSGTSKHFRSYVERLNTTVLRSCVSRSADKQMAEISFLKNGLKMVIYISLHEETVLTTFFDVVSRTQERNLAESLSEQKLLTFHLQFQAFKRSIRAILCSSKQALKSLDTSLSLRSTKDCTHINENSDWWILRNGHVYKRQPRSRNCQEIFANFSYGVFGLVGSNFEQSS